MTIKDLTLGQTYIDPATGVLIRKVTQIEPGDRFWRNSYSRRDPFSTDGDAIIVYGGNPGVWRVINISASPPSVITNKALHSDCEPVWMKGYKSFFRISGPNSYVGSPNVYVYDVDAISDLEELLFTVPNVFGLTANGARKPYITTLDEGSPSADQTVWAFLVFDANEKVVGYVVVEIYGSTPKPKVLLWEHLTSKPDYITATPSGEFIVIGGAQGIVAIEIDGGNSVMIDDKTEHSDILIDGFGNDWIVWIDFKSDGWVKAHCLQTGQVKKFIRGYSHGNPSFHFSGKAFDKPNWFVISTFKRGTDPLDRSLVRKILLCNVLTEEIREVVSDTENEGDNYWSEVHASISRDGSRILFNSDSMRGDQSAEAFIAYLPEDYSSLPLWDTVDPQPSTEPVTPTPGDEIPGQTGGTTGGIDLPDVTTEDDDDLKIAGIAAKINALQYSVTGIESKIDLIAEKVLFLNGRIREIFK